MKKKHLQKHLGLNTWLDKSDLAAGTIFLSLDDSQKVHVRGIEDDPISMWKTLKEVHMQQKPTARFTF